MASNRPNWNSLRRTTRGCAKGGCTFLAVATALLYFILFAGGAALISSAKVKFEEMGTAETDPDKWRKLLQEMSDQAVDDPSVKDQLTPEQIKRHWLGEPPATEAEIAAAEKRLGVRLPPSYRAFLKVSNGWHFPNSFVVKLAGTSEIGWARDVAPQLVSGWRQGAEYGAQQYGKLPSAAEDDLPDTLMINAPDEMDDGASFMLNPKIKSGDEMQAWFFSSWNPGADAHPSFWHLMVHIRDQQAEQIRLMRIAARLRANTQPPQQ